MAALMPGVCVAAAPICTGRDMLAEMKGSDAAAHARVIAAGQSTVNAANILWRIEGASASPSFLFGTLHLSDDRINALSPAVSAALEQAKSIALEIDDLSPAKMAAAMGSIGELAVFRDGRKLDDLLSPDEFDIAQQALQATGVPPGATSVLRPWLVMLSLALTECERKRIASGLLPLDMRLAGVAKRRSRLVVGLETLEDQFRAIAGVPEGDQLEMLRVSLRLYDRSHDLVETMVQRYLAREIGLIWPFQIELARQFGFSPAAFESFKDRMIRMRNARMRDAALPLIQAGGVFIAVGALHLPGEHGLVALLRQAGLTVVAVD